MFSDLKSGNLRGGVPPLFPAEKPKSFAIVYQKLLYINYTKLANKICGVSGRDNASMEQLSNLTVAENIILHCIDCGIQENKYYKDIYQDCKKRLEMFKDIAYLEVA